MVFNASLLASGDAKVRLLQRGPSGRALMVFPSVDPPSLVLLRHRDHVRFLRDRCEPGPGGGCSSFEPGGSWSRWCCCTHAEWPIHRRAFAYGDWTRGTAGPCLRCGSDDCRCNTTPDRAMSFMAGAVNNGEGIRQRRAFCLMNTLPARAWFTNSSKVSHAPRHLIE